MPYDEESLNIIHDTPMTGRLNMPEQKNVKYRCEVIWDGGHRSHADLTYNTLQEAEFDRDNCLEIDPEATVKIIEIEED
jgi:hypothetical protein